MNQNNSYPKPMPYRWRVEPYPKSLEAKIRRFLKESRVNWQQITKKGVKYEQRRNTGDIR